MVTAGRHRRPSPGRWKSLIVAAMVGAALGAGAVASAVAVATSGSGPPAPLATPQQVTTSRAPPPPTEIVRAAGPVTFAQAAVGPKGMSITVLTPEKVKGGVRLTVALANPTKAAIIVDTGELGPHDPSFNGAPVSMTMIATTKRLAPGEGYTYQCVLKLPTMDTGQLAVAVGPVTVTGRAAGD